MKFSIMMPGLHRYETGFDPWMGEITAPRYQEISRQLEALDFDLIDVPEHFALPRLEAGQLGPYWTHALTAMAFIAGATERIRVNSSAVILPCHHPVELAKAIATLDVLSGGRQTLTLGLGYIEAELQTLNVPFNQRGARADEYLEAMIALWTEDEPNFQGKFVSFAHVLFEPKPVQKPYPPLWIGGNTKAAMRRAVRFGTGWRPWLIEPSQLPQFRAYMESQPEYAKRRAPVEIFMDIAPMQVSENHVPTDENQGGRPRQMTCAEMVDQIGIMKEHGVTWTQFHVPRTPSYGAWIDHLEQLSAEVIAKVR